ncbi:FadR/GntR family transcriptional regulator [Azohydromonas sediminis]|uniref:FadR/GntR family transcriptional regulator n=1 Tax=Azohydromonas sediminis TaxID=2259674 RepID=UPI000E65983A|nr:FadR/GntR family transcriptional regulator [Azohydromonas sediminis]
MSELGVLQPPVRLSDRLAAVLQAAIECGELSPGDALPTEAKLVQQYGVSRTVVREAISRLKSTGLLVSRQGSGVYVAQAAANRPLLLDPALLGTPDAVIEVLEVRRALESEAAGLAAERADAATRRAILDACEAIDAAVAAGGDGVAEDVAFHRRIADASGNPQFGRLLGFLDQYVRAAVAVTRANEARRDDFAQQVRDEHRELARAIFEGDAARARAAAASHMHNAARRIREGIQARRVRPRAARRAAPTGSGTNA